MSSGFVTTDDGVQIFYKDWGSGQGDRRTSARALRLIRWERPGTAAAGRLAAPP